MTLELDNILRVAGIRVFERGWLSANNVLFANDGDETLLIDSGYSSHAEQTVALVRGALGQRQLDRVVNTHLHSDHCGGNDALQSAFNCAIDVPVGEAVKVDRWDDNALTFLATGQSCPRFRRTGVVRDGQVVRNGHFDWQVISAPGHDPESVVLYQPDLEILISADALWENGFGVVFPELEGVEAFGEVDATLARIRALDVKFVIPGHGKPFTDVRAALDRAYSRLSAFVADPRRHGRYAAKVLIKFHMLEIQRASQAELATWAGATPYMRLCHSLYFTEMEFDVWYVSLVNELSTAGAVKLSDGFVINQ
jgi:glyoxylase-like metal-dependent hydrolase (beta-lactamase superfamily II)